MTSVSGFLAWTVRVSAMTSCTKGRAMTWARDSPAEPVTAPTTRARGTRRAASARRRITSPRTSAWWRRYSEYRGSGTGAPGDDSGSTTSLTVVEPMSRPMRRTGPPAASPDAGAPGAGRTRAGKAGMPRGTAVKGGLVMVMVAPLPTPFRAAIRNRARRY